MISTWENLYALISFLWFLVDSGYFYIKCFLISNINIKRTILLGDYVHLQVLDFFIIFSKDFKLHWIYIIMYSYCMQMVYIALLIIVIRLLQLLQSYPLIVKDWHVRINARDLILVIYHCIKLYYYLSESFHKNILWSCVYRHMIIIM